jgi:hypothetical protein
MGQTFQVYHVKDVLAAWTQLADEAEKQTQQCYSKEVLITELVASLESKAEALIVDTCTLQYQHFYF